MRLANQWQSERQVQQAHASRGELIERIMRAIRNDGAVEPMEGLVFLRISSPTELGHGVSFPCFCVIPQGSKEVLLGGKCYRYDPAHYMIATAALPIAGRITEASKEEPYLSLILKLDPALVGSVMVEAGHVAPRNPSTVTAIDVRYLSSGCYDPEACGQYQYRRTSRWHDLYARRPGVFACGQMILTSFRVPSRFAIDLGHNEP
jgi:hypothetical protein